MCLLLHIISSKGLQCLPISYPLKIIMRSVSTTAGLAAGAFRLSRADRKVVHSRLPLVGERLIIRSSLSRSVIAGLSNYPSDQTQYQLNTQEREMPPSKSFVEVSVAPLPLSKHHSPSQQQPQFRKRARSPPVEASVQNERATLSDSVESDDDDDDGSDAATSKVQTAKLAAPSSSSAAAAAFEPPRKKLTKPRRRNTISATVRTFSYGRRH